MHGRPLSGLLTFALLLAACTGNVESPALTARPSGSSLEERIQFVADRTQVWAGECTWLRWEVES